MTLSDAARAGVLDAARGRDLMVMTRENMAALLKEMGKADCSEGDCEVETARNIGADYVLSGEIARIEGTYVVTLKLHESDDGRLLSTATARRQTQLDLIDSLRQRGMELVSANVDPAPASSQEIPRQLQEEPRMSSTLRVVSLGEMPAVSPTRPQIGYAGGGTDDSKLAYVPADVLRDTEILVQAANAKSLATYGENEQPDAAAAGENPAAILGMYQMYQAPGLAGGRRQAAATARARQSAHASTMPPPRTPPGPARQLAGPRVDFSHPVVTPRPFARAFRASGRGRR